MDDAGRLPADTTVGPVHLRVADMDRSLAFYQGLLDLHVGRRDAQRASLSATAGGPDLIRLSAVPGIRHRPPQTPGLYHFALLYPDRRDLGRTLLRLFERGVPFDGFADHGVSEAAYLSDPDGNGVELAADRPRAQWRRDDGDIVMYTQVLNVTNLLRAVDGDPWIGPPAGTAIGHVHLHVLNVPAAAHFYSDVLGFDVTHRGYPGAVFLAAGGYHHHIAVNAWARGARPEEGMMAGLIEFQVTVPDAAAREALSARLAAAGAPIEEDGVGFVTQDPERNRIRVR
jgi:catechol 2,3-dioxygenase